MTLYVERNKRTGGFDFTVGVWYVGSFMIMVVAIVYLIKSNPTPIINHHYSTVEVIEPPKKVIMEEEICTRIDGCRIIDNVCIDCI